jgi:23S rRNA pseudouridine2605 synthase
MRLNRFLAKAGIASRRVADRLLIEGRVAVNGRTVTETGLVIDESADEVTFDGKKLKLPGEHVYLLVNKPSGYLVTCRDDFKRPIILDLVPGYERLVRPVGRLDLDSSGLLLLTNDGELAFRLSHPRYKIDKKYLVKCEGSIPDEKLEVLAAGVELEDGRTWPATLELISRGEGSTSFHITLHEGRKRQIRRMCSAIGHKVVSLRRIVYGGISLGRLKSGSYRHLEKREVVGLKSAVGLS